MKHSVTAWQTAGFVFTSVLGTLLHFLYDWSGQSVAAALFSPVNESIWEHMKLIYYPMLLFALLEYFAWGKGEPRFWCIKLKGLGLALLLIPVLYYSYTGILGLSVDQVNIAIFFLAAGAGFWLETRLLAGAWPCRLPTWAALSLLGLMGLSFVILTFAPPHIPLFRDPITGTYGR